jgi:stage II sporulation protein P
MKTKTIFRFFLIILAVSLALALMLSALNETVTALAQEGEEPNYYTIYTESNEELTTRGEEEVEVGDSYISYDNKRYKIIEVDNNKKTCKAKYIEDVTMPNMNLNTDLVTNLMQPEKRAALYITHNDESYIPTDGTASIFGAGGIHDVARAFADALRQEGFITTLDETLHLPHDNLAYNRSRTTADKLIKQTNPDVLFDIHRDGAPRRIYDTVVGGEPMSKVRIVVGQGNPNFDETYQFALEIKALADEWYPGLINDVYLGARNYNQDLMPQALLLEFGSEQVEKELALKSVVPLATVVNGVLQRRAARAAYIEGEATSAFMQIQNDIVYNSVIFNLMTFVGALLVLFFVTVLSNKKLRLKTANFFKEVRSGLFISRK